MAKAISVSEAKELVLSRIATGATRAQAMAAVARSVETYRSWMKEDPAFKARIAQIKDNLNRGDREATVVPDFPEFSETYLRTKLPLHHMRIWDFLNGDEPRDMHESMNVEWAEDRCARQIINVPPDHAKSTTWTINYACWRIHQDPAIRILIISKTQGQAKKFLLSIKQRLTNPVYQKMHAMFAPQGGWRDDDLPWREDMIYVRGRDPEEKDPTVQALGIKGAIYGARADLVILDDAEDLNNYTSYEDHATWIAQDVDSRLVPEEEGQEAGRLLLVGTRVGGTDMYRYLRDARPLDEDEATYSYFKQPAILENAPDPDHTSWVMLWPERQTSKHVKKRRGSFANPRQFQLVYQQDDVPEDSVFRAESVRASVNGQRYPGPMYDGSTGHRRGGMVGLYVIGAWDPASSAGRNAMVVYGVDKQTKKRWLLDAWNKKGALPRDSIAKLKDWTELYGIREWVIEKNAVQEFIVQLDEIRDFLTSRGIRLNAHTTGTNKWDANKGVETLAPLFDSCVDEIGGRLIRKPAGYGQIELPHAGKNVAVQELVNQLIAWEPENKKQLQDLVMALWFAELKARKHLHGGMGQSTHMRSRFTARGAVASRTSITIDELHQQGMITSV